MRAAGRGRMVMISSVLGLVAAPWRGAYVATQVRARGPDRRAAAGARRQRHRRRPDRARGRSPRPSGATRSRISSGTWTGRPRRTAPPMRAACSGASTRPRRAATDSSCRPQRSPRGWCGRSRARGPRRAGALLRYQADPRGATSCGGSCPRARSTPWCGGRLKFRRRSRATPGRRPSRPAPRRCRPPGRCGS